jgi:hypothetical protein
MKCEIIFSQLLPKVRTAFIAVQLRRSTNSFESRHIRDEHDANGDKYRGALRRLRSTRDFLTYLDGPAGTWSASIDALGNIRSMVIGPLTYPAA